MNAQVQTNVNVSGNLAEITYLYCDHTNTNKNKNKNKTSTSNKNNRYHGNGTVQPIKSKDDIEKAKQYFHDNKEYRYSGTNIRNYCLFVLGINIGRRIGDILSLRICDVIDTKEGKIRDYIILREEKTNKLAKVYLNDNVKEAINEYLLSMKNYNNSDYLFKTRQSPVMTTNMAWKIMSDMGKELNLGNLGTHSMRKTFGYQILSEHKNDGQILATISELFNHSCEKVTRRYVGLDDEMKKSIYMGLNL